jgi:hypothetical protein
LHVAGKLRVFPAKCHGSFALKAIQLLKPCR